MVRTLETLYGGKRVTKFSKLGREYPIILQQYLADRKDKDGLSKFLLDLKLQENLVSLSSLVDFKEKGTASKHYQDIIVRELLLFQQHFLRKLYIN